MAFRAHRVTHHHLPMSRFLTESLAQYGQEGETHGLISNEHNGLSRVGMRTGVNCCPQHFPAKTSAPLYSKVWGLLTLGHRAFPTRQRKGVTKAGSVLLRRAWQEGGATFLNPLLLPTPGCAESSGMGGLCRAHTPTPASSCLSASYSGVPHRV